MSNFIGGRMVVLTPEEQSLLKEIVNDKFAVGAFSGMIFNAVTSNGVYNADRSRQVEIIDERLQIALQVRLRLKELAE